MDKLNKDISKKFASAEQKLRLVQLVEADVELKKGKFSSTFTKIEAKRRWKNISHELNSITGAKKSWEEWRKTWQDRKANAKKKFALLRRQANLTGGGPPPDPPTLEESLIINTFDKPSLFGHNDSQESLVPFIDLVYPVNWDKNSPSKIDLTSGNSKGSLNIQDATPKIDLSIPGTSKDGNATSKIDLSEPENCHTEEGKVRQATLPKSKSKNLPRESACRKRLVAQRRLQDGLNAAQVLNQTLDEKNAMKKQFNENYLKLMAQQVKALENIATALSLKI